MEISEGLGIEMIHMVVAGLVAFFWFAFNSLKGDIEEVKETSRKDDAEIKSFAENADRMRRDDIISVHKKIEANQERDDDKFMGLTDRIAKLEGKHDNN